MQGTRPGDGRPPQAARPPAPGEGPGSASSGWAASLQRFDQAQARFRQGAQHQRRPGAQASSRPLPPSAQYPPQLPPPMRPQYQQQQQHDGRIEQARRPPEHRQSADNVHHQAQQKAIQGDQNRQFGQQRPQQQPLAQTQAQPQQQPPMDLEGIHQQLQQAEKNLLLQVQQLQEHRRNIEMQMQQPQTQSRQQPHVQAQAQAQPQHGQPQPSRVAQHAIVAPGQQSAHLQRPSQEQGEPMQSQPLLRSLSQSQTQSRSPPRAPSQPRPQSGPSQQVRPPHGLQPPIRAQRPPAVQQTPQPQPQANAQWQVRPSSSQQPRPPAQNGLPSGTPVAPPHTASGDLLTASALAEEDRHHKSITPNSSAEPYQTPHNIDQAATGSRVAVTSDTSDRDYHVLSSYVPDFQPAPRFTPHFVNTFRLKNVRGQQQRDVPTEMAYRQTESTESIKRLYLDNSFNVDEGLQQFASGAGRLSGAMVALDCLDKEASLTKRAVVSTIDKERSAGTSVLTLQKELTQLKQIITSNLSGDSGHSVAVKVLQDTIEQQRREMTEFIARQERALQGMADRLTQQERLTRTFVNKESAQLHDVPLRVAPQPIVGSSGASATPLPSTLPSAVRQEPETSKAPSMEENIGSVDADKALQRVVEADVRAAGLEDASSEADQLAESQSTKQGEVEEQEQEERDLAEEGDKKRTTGREPSPSASNGSILLGLESQRERLTPSRREMQSIAKSILTESLADDAGNSERQAMASDGPARGPSTTDSDTPNRAPSVDENEAEGRRLTPLDLNKSQEAVTVDAGKGDSTLGARGDTSASGDLGNPKAASTVRPDGSASPRISQRLARNSSQAQRQIESIILSSEEEPSLSESSDSDLSDSASSGAAIKHAKEDIAASLSKKHLAGRAKSKHGSHSAPSKSLSDSSDDDDDDYGSESADELSDGSSSESDDGRPPPRFSVQTTRTKGAGSTRRAVTAERKVGKTIDAPSSDSSSESSEEDVDRILQASRKRRVTTSAASPPPSSNGKRLPAQKRIKRTSQQ